MLRFCVFVVQLHPTLWGQTPQRFVEIQNPFFGRHDENSLEIIISDALFKSAESVL